MAIRRQLRVPFSLSLWAVAAGLSAACQTPPTVNPPPAIPTQPVARAETTTASESAADAAARVITGDILRNRTSKISSDAFEGRGPATRGDRAARAYLSSELAALGLTPGHGPGDWEQPVELVGIKAAMPKSWTFEVGKKSVSLAWWDQYIAGGGSQTPTVDITRAEVVFVGYGIEAPEYGWDDFKGRDVRGKLLLVMNNDPDWDPALFAGATRLYYGRWTYKYENAARHGAAGVIIVHTTPSAGYPFQVVQSSWGGEQFSLPKSSERALRVQAWVTEDAARKLVGLAGKDLDQLQASARSKAFSPVALGISTSLHFANAIDRAQTANVFGTIAGRDPKLAQEYVVLSAHHDHLGIGKPDDKGDPIYNGALDNGAGVAQVLAIAQAFRALPTPPRRSILVLFPGAEEQGLLGSQYFTEHPPVPAGDIAANVNYDGGNIWGRTRDITQIGRGKSALDSVLARIAAQQGRTISSDPFPDRGSFYRSDQFNFAKIGVPALYLETGTDFIGRPAGWGKEQILDFEANRYHQPSDQLEAAWNFEGMVEDARLGFLTALAVADADAMPNLTPGDEFEAARKRATDALPH